MKTYFTAFLLCIFHFTCNAQWVDLNVNSSNNSYFTDVYAITPDVVIVVGSNGIILKTTDGGAAWQPKYSGTTLNLGQVQFPTSSIGYVTATEGKLLKTTDSGETWSTIDVRQSLTFLSLSCVNENLIYISALDSNYHSVLLKSSNGGIDWETIIGNNPQERLTEIQFLSGDTGYAKSDSYTILKTQDGGKNWVQIDNSNYNESSFNFINENIGFVYKYGLRKTTNGGNTFVQLGDAGYAKLSKMFAINENTVWSLYSIDTMCGCGSSGTMKITYDPENGYTESFENYDRSTTSMSSLYFSNDKLGYAVGSKNAKAAIWKNTTGMTVYLDANEAAKSDNIKIFPNPTSDKINIAINNQFSGEFSISLSDMSGKVLYNQNHNNKKDVSINVQNFAKGAYILTFKNQKQRYSQKIIVK
ncbi:MAG: YCF48-related protein [Bergeyella sp.]